MTGLTINTREGIDVSNKITVDRRLWLDDDGNLVEDGDPAAAFLWAVAGREVLESEADELGYRPKDEPSADVNEDYDTSESEDDEDTSDGDGQDDTPDGDAEAEEDEDEYVCDECGFEAKNAAGLGSHQRSHKDDD